MSDVITMLAMICGGSVFMILFGAYQLLKLPLVTNIIYIKLGTQSVTQVIEELANLKTDVPAEVVTNLVAISATLQDKIESGGEDVTE